MTITSAQTIVPARLSINVSEKRAQKPPPKVFNIHDHPFKGYQPPQPEGYEQSKANPASSAIVIDNGESRGAHLSLAIADSVTNYVVSCRLARCQIRLVFR